MKNNRFYVYAYCDPRKQGKFKYDGINHIFNFEPFYIGKGGSTNDDRLYYHLKVAKGIIKDTNVNPHKIRKIRKILNIQLEPIIYKIDVKLTEPGALLIEQDMITKIGRKSIGTGTLVNITGGGNSTDTWTGKVHSNETKLKMSISAKNRKDNPFKRIGEQSIWHNKTRSTESKQKMSAARKGKSYETLVGKKNSITWKKQLSKAGKTRKSRNLKITNPEGKIYYINTPLSVFCKQYGIRRCTLGKCLVTNKPILQGKSKGWFCEIV